MGRPVPLKVTPSHGGSGPHLIHGSLGPSESTTHEPKGYIDRCVRFAGRTIVIDRQTDRPRYTVTIDRICIGPMRSTATRPNNMYQLREKVYRKKQLMSTTHYV